MFRYTKRVLSLIFASVLLLNLLQTNVYAEDAVVTEEKVACNATLDDAFADNRVMVVLDNETSLAVDQFSTSMFSGISCKKVQSLTTAKEAKVQETMSAITAELNEVAMARNAAEIVTTENVMKIAATDEYLSSYKQVLCLELEETGKDKVLKTIAELEKLDNVVYAGPDYVLTVESTTPNDPEYTNAGGRWGIEKIQLPEAWDITTGSSTVYVAVIDTGIDGDHPDFQGRINSWRCRDFTSGEEDIPVGVIDDEGHGTMMAGIIGASGDNGIGITGACWNVKLVSLKVMDSQGNCYSSIAMMAIDYANLQGFPIINFSIGWYDDDNNENDNEFSNYHQQYDYALGTVIGSYSGLFVCSAGNANFDNDEIDHAPSNYCLNNMIVVGASTSSDEKWYKSNYGKQKVDLFAPGDDILSTSSTGGYALGDGTSIAAAYVSGVAALLLSMNPSLTTAELKEAILSSVDTISGLSERCVTGGRLNAYKAVTSDVAQN